MRNFNTCLQGYVSEIKISITIVLTMCCAPMTIAQSGDLILTEDLTVSGSYSGPDTPSLVSIVDVNDLNLNGFTITVECDTELKVNGDLVGPGYIQTNTSGCSGDDPKFYSENGFDNVGSCIEFSGEQNWLEFKSGDGDISIPNCVFALSTGNLIITEIMQNPAAVSDANGEYFEIYNDETNPVNLNGWTISNNSGSHTIGIDLIIEADSFIVLGRNSDSGLNGGVAVDYQYSGIVLSNGADEIVLTDGSATEIDRVVYDGGMSWPNPNGAAMIYTGSNIENNNDGSLWQSATIAEGLTTDLGSPGTNGTNQIVDWLVYDSNSWNKMPSGATSTKNALVRESESISFDSDISLLRLEVAADANVTVSGSVTLTIPNIILESTSTNYSSLISDGTLTGTVTYERHVNQTASSGGNDLISPPVTGQAFTDFLANNANIVSNSSNTLYLFGPFDKVSGSYSNYSNTESATLSSGMGYRAATTDNSTLRFEGTINQGNVNQAVFNSGPSYSEWNLIGNPYPSYLNVQDFLSNNDSALDATNVGIYGYDGDASDGWVIYNRNTTDAMTVIAPGQGFFVAVDSDATITFTPSMRRHGNSDDFIAGRTMDTNLHLKLELNNSNGDHSMTDFYFNGNSTNGLDLGYDAAVFGNVANSFALYSRLVDNDTGADMAIQSLPQEVLSSGAMIPLGVNAGQGEQLTIGIGNSNLPSDIDVYMLDTHANTTTHLNTENFIMTPMEHLNGTGRFYISFAQQTLGTTDTDLDTLRIYTVNDAIVISGSTDEDTVAKVFDCNGRLVLQQSIKVARSYTTLPVQALPSGVYILELVNTKERHTRKMIID